MVSTISPQLLAPSPYLFTSSAIGLFTLSSFIGIVVAYPIAGPLTDYLSRILRQKYHPETHVPEDRLPALLVAFVIAPPGLLVYAYVISNQGSVYAAATGYAMQISGLVLVPSTVLSVVVDGWPETGSEALVLINAGKNAIAAGVTLSSADWLTGEGLVKMCWEMTAIQWVILSLGFIVYFLGPWARKKTLWLL
jgi:MFS family permease